jgi:hypothetical protein
LLLLAPLCVHAAPVAPAAELEQRGARIGTIQIQVDDVFETRTHLAAPYRIANDLHISTHDATVQNQLLFHTGDKYDHRVLDETARILRAQRYLNEAIVEPVRYNEADNTVDVMVRVHDVWTLSPGLSFGRKGGENSSKLTFEDMNFLGLGKQLTFARSANVDRTAWELGYVDPNLLGSWWRLAADYAALSDGDSKMLSLERPFYALDTRWSAGLRAGPEQRCLALLPRSCRGATADAGRKFEIGGGFSEGLRRLDRPLSGPAFATTPANSSRYRISRTRRFPPTASLLIPGSAGRCSKTSTSALAASIRSAAPRRLSRPQRAPGARLRALALGSTHDGLILNGKLQAGADLGHEQYLIHSLGFGTRVEDTLANASLDLGDSPLPARIAAQCAVRFQSAGTVTSHRDPEEQLLLGGDNGLRGYPLRYQAGDALALFTLEQRFYTDWQPLKLVNVGAAVFFDAGRAWGRDPYAAAPTG